MSSIPSIPEITASSFDSHVLRSELPVLVLFYADGDATGRHLLSWLGEWTPRAANLLNIVRVAHAEHGHQHEPDLGQEGASDERASVCSVRAFSAVFRACHCYRFQTCSRPMNQPAIARQRIG